MNWWLILLIFIIIVLIVWWLLSRQTMGEAPAKETETYQPDDLTKIEGIGPKVQGLFNEAAVGVGIHPGQTGNLLSGARLQRGAELRGGVSMDQVLAEHLGRETLQPSLVLGCEQPVTGYHETNFSMAYSSHISWQDATSPVPMETYPSLAFDLSLIHI